MKRAMEGIEELKREVDSLIIIPNERLKALGGKTTSFKELVSRADEVLLQAVKGISELIISNGLRLWARPGRFGSAGLRQPKVAFIRNSKPGRISGYAHAAHSPIHCLGDGIHRRPSESFGHKQAGSRLANRFRLLLTLGPARAAGDLLRCNIQTRQFRFCNIIFKLYGLVYTS